MAPGYETGKAPEIGEMFPFYKLGERVSSNDINLLNSKSACALSSCWREERHPTLSASFRTMAEFMDYTSNQCGKYYSSMPEEGCATHVHRFHREKSEMHLCSDRGNGHQRKDTSPDLGNLYQPTESTLKASQPAENISKDLYIEVFPGTYSVTVCSKGLIQKTHVVAVNSGQNVDLVFPA
ncbi:A-kinase-interacting protein 1-like [Suncus etruscus]|uniref:A-kinase-interacting protein 1-like n=1 Tax=Suncus etruscus TaxID=109475 RepID=UPI0021107FD3|nr:A-kinase-interacting protein 1-like [Suncus etruscus]